MPLPPRIADGILRSVADAADAEACGLILGKDSLVRAWYPCRNVHEDPVHSFLLHPQDLRKALELAERLQLEILGVWHSHPEGPALLSTEDQVGVPADWLQWLVAPREER